MQEPDDDIEASPFRQPTASEQRLGLGCVVFVIAAMFALILIGVLVVFGS